jgi:hypothetical protein
MLLGGAGFVDGRLISISEPMWLGASADDAWTFVWIWDSSAN